MDVNQKYSYFYSMKDLTHQTRQAFFFSLGFYIFAVLFKILKVGFADMLISIALLISLIWVVLVFREVMLSTRLTNLERILLIVFIIFGNIIAGAIYFFLIRNKVIELVNKSKE